MTRIAFIALVVLGTACAAWPQTANRAAVPPTANDLQHIIEARQRDWSQSNAVLMEATRRLGACSPRLKTLLNEVRDTASQLAQANARYFQALLANERAGMQNDREFARSAVPAIDDIHTAAASLAVDPPPSSAAPKQLEPAPAGGGSGPARQLGDTLAAKETLLRQVEIYTAAEAKRWKQYYDGIEGGLRKLCMASQAGAKR